MAETLKYLVQISNDQQPVWAYQPDLNLWAQGNTENDSINALYSQIVDELNRQIAAGQLIERPLQEIPPTSSTVHYVWLSVQVPLEYISCPPADYASNIPGFMQSTISDQPSTYSQTYTNPSYDNPENTESSFMNPESYSQTDPFSEMYPADENPQNTRKNLKWLKTAGGILGCGLLIAGTTFGLWKMMEPKDLSAVMVCESSVEANRGNGYVFTVGEDGQTINQIEKQTTMSLDFIRENLGEDGAKEILENYRPKFKEQYEQINNSLSQYEWFTASLEEGEDEFAAVYTVNTAAEGFDYETLKDQLTALSLDNFYNSEKHAFLYDQEEFLKPGSILFDETIGCHKQEETSKDSDQLEVNDVSTVSETSENSAETVFIPSDQPVFDVSLV